MNSIGVAILLIAFSALAATAPTDSDMKLGLAAFECMKDHNLEVEDFEKLQAAGDDAKIEDISDDMKCAMLCISEKIGGVDENGKLKPDAMRTLLGEFGNEQFEEASKVCDEIAGSNTCEIAFLSFGCVAAHRFHNSTV